MRDGSPCLLGLVGVGILSQLWGSRIIQEPQLRDLAKGPLLICEDGRDGLRRQMENTQFCEEGGEEGVEAA